MSHSLDFLFRPRSIALVGITLANPEHWTRTFLNALLEFRFEGPIYLINPKGGEINGMRVYPNLEDVPGSIDYVISTVPARAAPKIVEACARKGVKAIHFCTAGFGETGDEEDSRLEAELSRLSRNTRVRVIGPNCMGLYCPKSHLSYSPYFPKESGPVGVISQSGGNATSLIRQGMLRGLRFSEVISYGNACDLNESDFLEYLADDSDTRVIALYIEGVKDGRRFRQALEKAAKEKIVLLLKGGIGEGGARAAAGHTGALAGSNDTWDALCRQLGVIRVDSMEDLTDMLVTSLFLPPTRDRNVALIGFAGGASVLITDEFERRGLKVPPLPQGIRNTIREFIPAAGNILRNPIDCSQVLGETGKVIKLFKTVSEWEEIDLIIGFLKAYQTRFAGKSQPAEVVEEILTGAKVALKPVAIVFEPSIVPADAEESFSLMQSFISAGLPLYFSSESAAKSLSLHLTHSKRWLRRQWVEDDL